MIYDRMARVMSNLRTNGFQMKTGDSFGATTMDQLEYCLET